MIEWSSHSGSPPELTDLSLVSTLSSAQKAAASWYLLAAKARRGLRSASIVKIESESVSIIFQPSARPALGRAWRQTRRVAFPAVDRRNYPSHRSRGLHPVAA